MTVARRQKRSTKSIAGHRFGRLVARERVGSDNYGNSLWSCQCDCGKIKEISSHNLKAGRTRSCGCLRRETAARHPTMVNSPKKERAGWVSIARHGYTNESEVSIEQEDIGSQ